MSNSKSNTNSEKAKVNPFSRAKKRKRSHSTLNQSVLPPQKRSKVATKSNKKSKHNKNLKPIKHQTQNNQTTPEIIVNNDERNI